MNGQNVLIFVTGLLLICVVFRWLGLPWFSLGWWGALVAWGLIADWLIPLRPKK